MKKRHGVLLLLTSLAAVTYLDRLCIATLGPEMQKDLELSPMQWGWVLAAFNMAYGTFEIPCGAWGDRFGQRQVLMRIVLWWSAFTAITGAVSSITVSVFSWHLFVPAFYLLVLVRFLFAAGEAGAFPNISGSSARWFPPTERGRVQGLVWGASRLGAVLAPWLVYLVMTVVPSWRVSFWIFGCVGLLWSTFWYRFYHDHPADHPTISREELQEIGAGSDRQVHRGFPWAKLLRARQLWLIMAMYFFYAWGSNFYLGWLHTYLVDGRGFTSGEMKFVAPFPFLLGALANPLGGFLIDSLGRRLGLRTAARLVGSTCLAGTALILLATAATTGKWSGIVLLALGFGLFDLMLPTAWSTCVHVGGKFAGVVSGAMNSSGQVGGATSVLLFGYLVERFHNYNVPLTVIACMLLVSSLLFSRIDPSRPLLNEDEDREPAPA